MQSIAINKTINKVQGRKRSKLISVSNYTWTDIDIWNKLSTYREFLIWPLKDGCELKGFYASVFIIGWFFFKCLDNGAPFFSYFVRRASLLFVWSNKITKPQSTNLQKLHDYHQCPLFLFPVFLERAGLYQLNVPIISNNFALRSKRCFQSQRIIRLLGINIA